MRGPKYSPGLRCFRVHALPSQPMSDAMLPHQLNLVSVYCKAKKMMMPEIAMPQDQAAERTKLY